MGSLELIVFYTLAVLAVFSATRAVFGLNLMRSLTHFGVFLITVSGLFYILQAEFISLSEIFVYAGGILVLMLFAVMLEPDIIRVPLKRKLPGLVLGYFIPLTFFLIMNSAAMQAGFRGQAATPEGYTVDRLGFLLLDEYLVPFEVLGAVLLVAVVGAVWLVKERKENDG